MSTRTIYVRNRFCTHCRMTNENLWIERVFQGRFIDKSFTGNRAKNKGKTQTAKIKYKFDRRVFVASMRMKRIGTKAYDLRTVRQQGFFLYFKKSAKNSEHRRLGSETEKLHTEAWGSVQTVLHVHSGKTSGPPEKPNTIMCQLFFFFL